MLALALWLAGAGAWAAPPTVDLQDDPQMASCRSAASGMVLSGTVAFTSNGGDVYLYETAFDAVAWSGSVRRRPVLFDAHGQASAGAADWDAGVLLQQADPATRRIFTMDAEGGMPRTIPFEWTSLPATQQAWLDRNAEGVADGLGEQRVRYLRGDRSLELDRPGGIFRRRQLVLGDIVHGKPVLAAGPVAWPAAPGAEADAMAGGTQPPVVFAGANDGMLHAFDGDNGSELFAYVPRALFPFLAGLTDPGQPHRAYVDGSMTLAVAQFGNAWRRVLVAGMRGGAQGVFALDVSEPAHFGRTGALWEFTDADDAAMGNVIGAPAVGRFRIVRDGRPSYRYFAVVAGGVDSQVDDGRRDASGAPALFLLALDKPTAEQWQAGVNYFRFVLPAGAAGMPNGLAEPALVEDDDGMVAAVYAGDLQGNLWRFDFGGASPWPDALGGAAPKPVFIAADESGRRQPITQKPAVVFAPGGRVVLFGTGKLLEGADLDARHFQTQSFYGVLDVPGQRGSTPTRRALAARTLLANTDGTMRIRGDTFRYGADRAGWYVDFIDSATTGERSVTHADVEGGAVLFYTVTPSVYACRPASSRFYRLDALYGLTPPDTVYAGLTTSEDATRMPDVVPPAFVRAGPPDVFGRRILRRTAAWQEDGAMGDGGRPAPAGIDNAGIAGRLSWREIVDWNEARLTDGVSR